MHKHFRSYFSRGTCWGRVAKRNAQLDHAVPQAYPSSLIMEVHWHHYCSLIVNKKRKNWLCQYLVILKEEFFVLFTQFMSFILKNHVMNDDTTIYNQMYFFFKPKPQVLCKNPKLTLKQYKGPLNTLPCSLLSFSKVLLGNRSRLWYCIDCTGQLWINAICKKVSICMFSSVQGV